MALKQASKRLALTGNGLLKLCPLSSRATFISFVTLSLCLLLLLLLLTSPFFHHPKSIDYERRAASMRPERQQAEPPTGWLILGARQSRVGQMQQWAPPASSKSSERGADLMSGRPTATTNDQDAEDESARSLGPDDDLLVGEMEDLGRGAQDKASNHNDSTATSFNSTTVHQLKRVEEQESNEKLSTHLAARAPRDSGERAARRHRRRSALAQPSSTGERKCCWCLRAGNHVAK